MVHLQKMKGRKRHTLRTYISDTKDPWCGRLWRQLLHSGCCVWTGKDNVCAVYRFYTRLVTLCNCLRILGPITEMVGSPTLTSLKSPHYSMYSAQINDTFTRRTRMEQSETPKEGPIGSRELAVCLPSIVFLTCVTLLSPLRMLTLSLHVKIVKTGTASAACRC
jgi:hypothetical protein